jgi:hypothetical protein
MTSRLIRAALLSMALASVLGVTALTRADVDLWGHLRFGLDILESRGLESVDPYSFTSDRAWINHEWLSEIAIAAAWLAGGSVGLILLKLLCILGALGFMAAALRDQGVGGRPQIMLLGLTLIGLLMRVTHVRPQLFSVLLFAALVFVFVRSERGSPRTLLWTVPILVLWANFHGGWLVGVGTVGVWCAGASWNGQWPMGNGQTARLAPILIAVAATLATLINPYGVGLWAFLFETVRFGREAIVEWGPIWRNWTTMGTWGVAAALAVVGICRGSGLGTRGSSFAGRNPAAFVIPIFWGLAAIRVSRLDAFFTMSAIGLLAGPIATMFARRSSGEPLPLAWKAGAVAGALLLMIAVPPARRTLACIGIHPTWPEPAASDFMRERQMAGRIVTFFDWGEYAIWNMPSDLKVSMDGRRETVYSDRTVASHLQLYGGSAHGLAYLDELDADYVWLPRTLPVVPMLQQRGWQTIYEGPISIVLAEDADAAASSAPVRGAASAVRCFPGP